MATRAFRFALQRVLDVRQVVERRVQTELASLETALERWRQERASLERRVEQAQDALRAAQQGEPDLVEQQLQRAHIRRLDQLIHAADAEIRLHMARIEAKRAELIQAATDRRVMERLRDRAYDAWVAEHLRREQIRLDEVGVQGFFRARNSPADPAPREGTF
ncbi:MAG TPA: flagellar export protein FliJ [Armatimonadota bacterium]|nr:flagellar export protein FliJ [Armatimonadota bacterium]